MSDQLTDIKYNKLQPTFGIESVKNLERQHVRSLITVPPSDAVKQLDDLWDILFDQEGISPGNFNDRATEWLIGKLSQPGATVYPEWQAESGIAAGVGTLSGGNGAQVWTKTSANGGDAGVHSAVGRQSGKWYAELTVTPTTWIERPGIVHRPTPESTLSRWHTAGTHDYSWGWDLLGEQGVFHNSAKIVSGMGNISPSQSTNYRIMIALDIDAGKLWFGYNNGWRLSGNPVTGANPQASGLPSDGSITYYVGAWGYYTNVKCTCYFNATLTPPRHTVPTGYTVWQDNYVIPPVSPENTELPNLWWEYWNAL